MDINERDFRLVLIGCFRYSLGRKTYMPSTIIKIIKQNEDVFSIDDWEGFIDEIRECDDLGDKCDLDEWTEFKEFAEDKIKELGGEDETK